MKSFGFPRRARLRGRWEFTRAQRSGEKIHLRFFLVFALPSVAGRGLARRQARKAERNAQRSQSASQGSLPRGSLLPQAHATMTARELSFPTRGARLGVTVTKKVGNAVQRNRIKRWVREAFRRRAAQLPCGLDLVVVAKQQITQASFADVVADFERLTQRKWKSSPTALTSPLSTAAGEVEASGLPLGNGRDAALVLKVGRKPGLTRPDQEKP